MRKRAISTPSAPTPGGAYSQAIAFDNLVFLSGQGPFTSDGKKVEGEFVDAARQTFENLAAVAEAAGGSLDDAVRVGVFLTDMSNFPVMNEVYGSFFSDPLPARTTVQSGLPGFEIEVDAILALDA